VRASSQPEVNSELFRQLRLLRRQLAEDAGVPPYVVFSDRTLVDMARACPQNELELLAIPGIGELKMARYGPRFLHVIREHCGSTNVSSPSMASTPQAEATPWLTVRHRFHEIGEQFHAGHPLDELAKRHKVKRQAIIRNLHQYFQTGGTLDRHRLLAESKLAPADRNRVLAAFEQLGLEYLAPAHEALDGAVSYEELHLIRLYLIAGGSWQGD
jgi:ATP-dependent DNA helicase RecQ